MLPRLIHIRSFYLPTYGVMLAIAYLTAIALLRRKARREGLSEQKILDLSIYVLGAAILGAKLLLVIVDLRAWKIADMGAPAIALGEAIGRWGCFAAGCCWGKEWHGPWAVTFTDPFTAENVGTPLNQPLHPTQIYLSINAFLIFLALQWAYRRKDFDGEVFWLYVLLYAITRSILEIWRGDPVRGFLIPGVLSTSQFIGILAALFSLGMLFYLSRRPREVEA